MYDISSINFQKSQWPCSQVASKFLCNLLLGGSIPELTKQIYIYIYI